MKQLIFIHGGSVFPDKETLYKTLEKREYDPTRERRKKRKNRLAETLQSEYEIFNPPMPNDLYASYSIRKLRFEKVQKIINNEDLILIGHSLGAMFLIKYIGECGFCKKIKQLHLLAGMFDNNGMREEDSYVGDFAYSPEIFSNLEKYVEQIFLYHSKDDPSVPYSHSQKIKAYLPKATLLTFTDRGHFNQPEFPEVLENIMK